MENEWLGQWKLSKDWKLLNASRNGYKQKIE